MITDTLGKLMRGIDLSRDEMTEAMDQIMEGKCSPVVIAGFLTALRCKGETIDELAAAVSLLRSKSTKVPVQNPDVIDTCGTGGDHSGSFNISTVSAIVAAGAGVYVAKHGNKAMSSSCGSANVLQAAGLNLDLTPEQVGQSIDKHHIGFLFAMKLHGAMKHVGPVRQELKQRTIFNILGPMLNPASASKQIIGVFEPSLTMTLAKVLQKLESDRVLVVCGNDGLDEITLTTTTKAVELHKGDIREFEINPEELGFSLCTPDDLKGGSAAVNAKIMQSILLGQKGPKTDVVLLNAGAAIHIAGKAADLKEGVELARKAVDSGKAAETLSNMVNFSN